jgi:hypothetical protein
MLPNNILYKIDLKQIKVYKITLFLLSLKYGTSKGAKKARISYKNIIKIILR